ncbi:hypothetical protein [Bacillus toyonensis]|nr:hypothetical protein [Bacillus toyonensis]
MRKPETTHTGIVIADFPGAALIEGVIALNKNLRKNWELGARYCNAVNDCC